MVAADSRKAPANFAKGKEEHTVQKLVIRTFAYAMMASLSLFIVLVTLSNSFPEYFGSLFHGALYHSKGGVYANCELQKNFSNPICERLRRQDQSDGDWRDMNRGASGHQPFKLH